MAAAGALLPEGQEIVVYKNNSDGKGNSYGCHENYLMDRAGPVRSHRHPRDAALHHAARSSPARARSGTEAPGIDDRRGAVPAHPASRLLRGGGRARDHAQAADRQHPRRAARRRPEVPAAPRHRRRRQPVRGRHLPQGRHDRDRAGDDRGRLPARATSCSPRRCRRCARCPTTCRCATRSSWPTARRSPRSRCSGSYFDRARKYAEEHGLDVRRCGRGRRRRARAVGAGAHRASRPTRCRSPTSSTGWRSTG